MKNILALVLLLTAFSVFADNATLPKFKDLTPVPGQQEQAGSPVITEEAPVPQKEIDYTTRPKVNFEENEWTMVRADKENGQKFWLKTNDIDQDAEKIVVVAMIEFPSDIIVPGVGTQIRKVFSEAIVDCPTRMMYPLRDVYTTVDRHIVGIHTVRMPLGAMQLNPQAPLNDFVCKKKS